MPISDPGASERKMHYRRLPPTHRGFTLVEVMVVLVIVGIVASGVSLGLNVLHGRDEVRAIERLRRVLEATAQRASTRGQSIAVELLADGYRFRMLGADGNWRLLEDPPVFGERVLPGGFAWGELSQNGKAVPAIGQRLTFTSRPPEYELALLTPDGALRYTGRISGEVSLTKGERQ